MYSGLASIILRLYDLAYIERWNDHPRPFNISELDKQAHKAAIAYVIGRFEESFRDRKVDWLYLIEGLIFEALQRAVLTDIKPQVFHRITKERSKEINKFVFDKVGEDLRAFDRELYRRFVTYFEALDEPREKVLAKRIIKAAHFLATYWEFNMIYSVGIRFYGIEKVKEGIEDTIEDFFDLVGVERIYLRKKTFNFVDLVGQLRFQKRWILSPRIPATTVLGHVFIVAALSYLLSLKLNACPRRKFLNFFTGLFHDLPEVTTRDVISPVKKQAGISSVLKKYEKQQVEEVILPLLPEFLRQEFAYMLGFLELTGLPVKLSRAEEAKEGSSDELSNRIIHKGRIELIDGEIKEEFNTDEMHPIDGGLIKASDVLGTYTEAALSLHHGIRSKNLKSAKNDLNKELRSKSYRGIDFGQLVEQINERLKES